MSTPTEPVSLAELLDKLDSSYMDEFFSAGREMARRLKALDALHVKYGDECKACDPIMGWPCPSRRALDGEEVKRG